MKAMTKTNLSILVIVFLTILIPFDLVAQITIAPTNLFVDSQNRFGSYIVINNSNQPYEVSIDFLFGYSDSDEEGNRFVNYEDSATAERYSIADWIRAFPQNLTLAPNQRQVVRLRINPPSDLPDGTYWARISTSATAQSAPVEVTSEEGITANIGMRINQITGIFYKNGSVNTNISINNIETQVEENNLVILHDISRGGNSPFLGSVIVKVVDSQNEVVRESVDFTSIYFDTKYKNTFDISDLPSGTYNIQISISSERQDISSSDLVQMQPATATTTVTIP